MPKKFRPEKLIKEKPIHPWRLCPAGEHWVRTHPLRIPPSKKNPAGSITTRQGHCAKNLSNKNQLYADEIQEISKRYFGQFELTPLPTITISGRDGNVYDHIIQGWTKYWNDVLKPLEPLDPIIVKALIASESSFDPKTWNKKKGPSRARGLSQITDKTVRFLSDDYKELKDHYLNLTENDMLDPTLSICAGIRWLFRKKELREAKLGRPISWLEAVEAYKGLGKLKPESKRRKELMDRFYGHYNDMKGIK